MSMLPATRGILLFSFPASIRPIIAARLYATQTGLGTTSPQPGPRRETVTVFNDNGRVPWGNLSKGEKIARATQQTFNLGFMVIGAVLTGGVAYFLYTEVFSLDSKTVRFNKAVDRVKEDPRCTEILGSANEIIAYGEPTYNKWARARPIASSISTDQQGVQHLIMHFNVEGPRNKGVVSLHVTKSPAAGSEWEYKYLKLDVKGHQSIYLEGGGSGLVSRGGRKMFGVSWTR